MKYLKFSPIILALVFLLYYYFGVYHPQKQVLPSQNEQSEQESVNSGQTQWETKSDDQPPVAVTVTPIEFGQDAEQWRFTVVFDTHSGSLDQDPAKVILLSDDKGNVYQPVTWKGPGPGGHHREGILIFAPIQPAPKFIELKIKDVGGVAERSFMWNLD